jgi:mRNA interferase YafQ
MRRIERTTVFARDFKREKRSGRHANIDLLLADALTFLVDDKPLPPMNHDHPLAGEWQDFRECHLRPDLLLIYRKPDAQTLHLVRMGSHSEIFE